MVINISLGKEETRFIMEAILAELENNYDGEGSESGKGLLYEDPGNFSDIQPDRVVFLQKFGLLIDEGGKAAFGPFWDK